MSDVYQTFIRPYIGSWYSLWSEILDVRKNVAFNLAFNLAKKTPDQDLTPTLFTDQTFNRPPFSPPSGSRG